VHLFISWIGFSAALRSVGMILELPVLEVYGLVNLMRGFLDREAMLFEVLRTFFFCFRSSSQELTN